MNNIEYYNFFSGKKILITGASGYIAYRLIDVLKQINCSLFCVSRGAIPSLHNCQAKTILLQRDITKKETFEDLLPEMDIIYHLAAQTSINTAEQDPYNDFIINVLPMLNILELCRIKGYKPSIVFAGTVTQVGKTWVCPVNESFSDKPITIYDIHKLMAESYLRYYVQKKIVRGVTLRLSNVYGPGPKEKSSDRGMLNLMIRKALCGDVLTVYGTGKPIRDFVFIDDVVDAFCKAAIRLNYLTNDYYIIGSGKGYSIADAVKRVATSVLKKTGKKVFIEKITPKVALHSIEERHFVADPDLFSSAAQWAPKYNLQDGIDLTIRHYTELGCKDV